jgi:hypothetical protein
MVPFDGCFAYRFLGTGLGIFQLSGNLEYNFFPDNKTIKDVGDRCKEQKNLLPIKMLYGKLFKVKKHTWSDSLRGAIGPQGI